jgi:hypothetical protein
MSMPLRHQQRTRAACHLAWDKAGLASLVPCVSTQGQWKGWPNHGPSDGGGYI